MKLRTRGNCLPATLTAALSAGQEAMPQARAGLLPNIGVSGDYSRNEVENAGSFNSSSYTLALTQPLFRWANWQQYEQSKLSVAASEAVGSRARKRRRCMRFRSK